MNKSVEIKQYKHKMLQYFSVFFFFTFVETTCPFSKSEKNLQKIYNKQNNFKASTLDFNCLVPSDCEGPFPTMWALHLGRDGWVFLSILLACVQQQLQTWLKSQWIPEKTRIKHDKKILKNNYFINIYYLQ